jgi:hypothetical protein
MNYNKAVTEGRKLLKRSEADSWRLAELTFEVVNGGKSRRQWAKDLGVHNTLVNRWYLVWDRWGADRGLHQPRFADAYSTVALGSDELVTTADRGRLGRERQLPRDPEDRAEMARKLLADPEVRKNPEVRRETKAVQEEVDAEVEAKWADVEPLGPVSPRRSQTPAALAYLPHVLTKTRRALREALNELRSVEGTLPEDIQGWLLEDVEELRAGLELFEAAVKDEDADWDAGLARLLNERQ